MDSSGTHNQKRVFIAIILGALLIRIVLALISDNFNHPDENFQIYEQAHRLVFGYGLVPWEFRFDARSWIVPGLVAAMLYPFKLLGCDNPNIYVPSMRIFLGIISLIVVISAYFIGKKISSVKAGLWAAFFCAGWYEIIYFSIRPLSEVWATTFFVAAIALSIKSESSTKLIIAGVLSALTIAVRLHYFPAVLIYIIVLYFVNDKRKPIVLHISFIITILLVGIFEKITVGGFYQSYIDYYHLSKTFSMTETSSGMSIFAFAGQLGYSSLFIIWAFLLLGILLWRKVWYLLLIVLTALILHSILPLKEYIASIRFVYLIIPLYMIIGGIAVAEIINKLNLKSSLIGSIVVIFFLAISALGAFDRLPGEKKVYEHNIFYRDPGLSAYQYLYKQKNLAAVFDNADFWFQSGGYYYLHRDVPLYFNNTPPPSLEYVSHIVTKDDLGRLEGFAIEKRFGDLSIYARTDKNFNYKTDYNFDRNMYQPGIDDNRHP
jgi:GPI mannosyltransferase 3